jgi:hypothetical protein
VPKLEIWEHPPSTLRNVDDGPLGGADGDPRAPTINVTNVDGMPPEGANGDPRSPTINVTNVDDGPPGPLGVWSPSMICKCAVTYIGSIDKSNSAHGSYSPCA